MSKPALTCWGGAGTVTGANFMFEAEGKKYLIDCGLLQGVPGAGEINGYEFPYDVASIEALFITHAHVDHIGRIPKLLMAGFGSPIYSTPETKEIAEVMLRDLVHIEALDEHLVESAMKLWHGIPYHEKKKFSGFELEIFDSGHILGSGMLKLTFDSGKSIMFTGDLGNSPSPLLKPTEEIQGLTYLLMESVYGNRNHEAPAIRDAKFRELVLKIAKEGKTLVIPVFSLERAQLVLFELDDMYEKKLIKGVPVFLDSPLAIRLTDIYRRLVGRDPFDFPMLRETAAVRDSQSIQNVGGAKIILAGSGMSTAGRILFHEERYLPDPKAVILFVGFQAPGTLGRRIQEGMKEVMINDHKVPVRAEIATIDGYSAHAGSDQLVEFASHSTDTLEKVFVAMGEPKSSIFLAQRLHDELGVEAVVPERGKKYELDL